jgi:hypothetical protein
MDRNQHPTRRTVLRAVGGALGVATVGSVAGCLDNAPDRIDIRETAREGSGGIQENPDGPQPILADERLHMGHSLSALESAAVGGGPGVDGIPSVDDPEFQPAAEADLDDGEPVFGVVRNGVAKAYPQSILVWHEIVNDEIGGEPVAVAYCPLTGTAQGFERGETTFGVSGLLVNSNLLMYDRGTGTRWPQITATGIAGPLADRSLAEFPVVWSTWGNWREANPDTQVLTTNTGYQRRYGSDPYGGYNPPSDYYSDDSLLFDPLESTDAEQPKAVVIGARTPEGAIAFKKESLLTAGVLTGEAGGISFVAVADPALETGYVYRNDAGATVEAAGGDEEGQYSVDGQSADAAELLLDRVVAFDAMFFAWFGFYPGMTYVD